MTKIGIFYGSTTGNTKEAAEAIATEFGCANVDVKDVSKANANEFSSYQYLILGTSTWGAGDLQDDWNLKLEELSAADLKDKKIAIFGLGDQSNFSDTFVDGMAVLYEKVHEKGAIVTGLWPLDGYDFISSQATKDNHLIGLALDIVNQSSLTSQRIKNWVSILKEHFK